MNQPNDLKHAKMVKLILKRMNYGPLYEIESPFNYYGERGVIDLVQMFLPTEGGATVNLWEMKTTLRNIGELLRQIHRASQYFLKGRETICGHKIPGHVHLQTFLVFLDTPENWQIFDDNIELLTEPKLLIYVISNGKLLFLPDLEKGQKWVTLYHELIKERSKETK